MGAVVGQHFGAGEADAACSAGDKRGPAVNAEQLGYFHGDCDFRLPLARVNMVRASATAE